MLNQVFITLWFDSPSDSRARFFLPLFLFFFAFHSIPSEISIRNNRIEDSNNVESNNVGKWRDVDDFFGRR